MKQKTALIILISVLILSIGALIVQIIIEKTINEKTVVRALVPMALAASGIAKVVSGSGSKIRNNALYETEYRKELGRAFYEDGRRHIRSQLLNAVGNYNQNKFEKAVKQLQELLKKCQTEDDFKAVLLFLALCFTDMRLNDAAINTYYDYLKYDQTSSTVWSNLGILFRGKGRNGDAISCYKNAIKYDKDNPYSYNNMAATYYAIANYDLAIDNAKKSLEIKSNLYQAASTLCLAYFALNNIDESERYFKIAVSNGADETKLNASLDSLKSGNRVFESIVPIPQSVQTAMNKLYRKTAIPFVHVVPTDDESKSRLGGDSVGEPPVDSKGNPMRLLCVINCSDVRGIPDFPSKGILRFFIADNDTYGADFDSPNIQKDFRVLYAENDDGLDDVKAEIKNGSFPIKNQSYIHFIPEVAAMSFDDFRFRDIFDQLLAEVGETPLHELTNDIADVIIEKNTSVGSRISGYPYFTQADPRGENDEYKKYDTLLLQLDSQNSEFDFDIMVGNNGVMSFFIPHEKLKVCDFSDILYWWDCA
ncbi:MAG: DUF1963 domain-containing protein [Eubacteriales bacterium]|nr:DUF1963 domain-containing protein [Eubacteriales bacterium]